MLSNPLFRLAVAVLAASCLPLSAAVPDGGSSVVPPSGGFAPGVVLVKLNPSAAHSNAAGPPAGMRVLQTYPFIGWQRLALPDGVAVQDAVAGLRARADVLCAEPDFVYHFDAVPNDPMYSQQWAPAKIGLPAAWDVTTGSSSVVVASIDTGITYTHTDLVGNLWHNPGETANGVDDDSDGYVDDLYGINAYLNTGDPADDTIGHGTWTSGCIGAVGNNGIGVVGANWSVGLMAIKVNQTNVNSFLDSAILAGYQYAVLQKSRGVNIRVINNSWAGYGFSQSLSDAITAASNAGILSVCSAGNGDAEGNPVDDDVLPLYPAGYQSPTLMSIAASDSSDNAATFTNYGPRTVDLAAPGVAVLSTSRDGSYQSVNGTSFSAPYVSGACALLCAAVPSLTPADLKSIIDLSPDILANWAGKTVAGGRLNVGAAMQNALLANHLAFTSQPSDKTAGVFATQPVVKVLNAAGVVQTSYHGPVTLSLRTLSGLPGAALSGTTTVNAVNGVATFSGLGITTPGANYVLKATSTGVRAALAAPFTIGLSRVYVSSTGSDAQTGDSWAHAKATIGAGLLLALPGGEVWVAAGAYNERVSLPANLGLYGGFAGNETLRSQQNPHANVTTIVGAGKGSVVTISTSAARSTVIDGFTITGGNSPYGGGITCWYGAPTITHNVVTANHADQVGGGIDCEVGNPDIEGNTISSNTSSSSGTGYGGGIYVYDCTGTVAGNTIISNACGQAGGGMDLDTCPAGLTIHGNVFQTNTGLYGAGVRCRATSSVITDNLFVSNRATSLGGAIFSVLSGANPQILNNTLTGNTAPTGGGMAITSSSDPTIVNNIVVSGNSGIYSDTSGVITRRNNDFYGNNGLDNVNTQPGTGEISANPEFIDPTEGHYDLFETSPCRDTGDDTVVSSGDTDINGKARIQGAHVDMGASEYNASAPVGVPRVVRALRIWAGILPADTNDLALLNVVTTGASAVNVDLADAVRLARRSAGLDP